jgi:seryl-tRNA synthetase
MLDLKYIRDNPERVREALAVKNTPTSLVDEFLAHDTRRREIIAEVEALKQERNQLSQRIADEKKAGRDASEIIAHGRVISDKTQSLDAELREVEDRLLQVQLRIPNCPHSSVPIGDETHNRDVRSWGQAPRFPFKAIPHWELGQKLAIYDGEAGANVSGSGFFVLRGDGARLQRALINFMLDHHAKSGYVEHRLPYLVNSKTMQGTGQLPKLADDMYRIESDDMWLIPTAEVPMTNLEAGSIMPQSSLPRRWCAYPPCFRREAGAAGKDTRGMIRVHQFDKVELVKVVEPASSYDELEYLTTDAETVLQLLGLPYRVRMLASGDLSFAAAKCYDLEVFSAGIDGWLEVSSCSNFEDFQARRMDLRVRPTGGGKVYFPHTLNGSALALPRTMIAIMENYQTEHGTIKIPSVLNTYMGGQTEIG